MSKIECVANHLEKFKSITSWEAIQNYGVTRLAASIYDLRHRGMKINGERIKFTDRFGNTASYTRYTI